MDKLYFQNKDDNVCYNLIYFKWILVHENLDEIILFEAQRQYIGDVFWCKEYQTAGDKNEGTCGKFCEKYEPKNGISGCCKHYSLKLYEPSDKQFKLKK